jgi:hypothetical protein
MIVFSVILSAFGIAFFCWLLYVLAVYALPFFAAISAGLAAFHSGVGVIGAIIVGVVAGIATLGAGQLAFGVVVSPLIRAAIALVFAAPAAVAGYHAILSLSRVAVPSHRWGQAFAVIGALFAGTTAWARIMLFADPLPSPSGAMPPSSAHRP